MTTTTYTYYPNTVRSLFSAHSSQAEIFAFSAKERDAETGLSYFGSRYYSSDLSVWLSVDPMSDKYPSLSPYVYCADNPVKLVDPDGMKWETAEDEAMSKSMISKAESQLNINWEAISDITSKASKDELSTEEQAVLNDLIYMNSLLSEGISNLKDMGGENTETYHFNHIEDNDMAGNVKLRDDGVININYSEECWAWHECVHIGDYRHILDKWNFNEDGFLATTKENFANSEYKAYCSQYAFDKSAFIYSESGMPVNGFQDVIKWVEKEGFDQPLK